MSSIIENHLCYFCDNSYPHPSCYLVNYSGVWICEGCEMIIPINNFQEKGECCVCLEDKFLIELPSCMHKLCFDCSKTIYFGSTTNETPSEISIECPEWPYELDDDNDNDPEKIKYDEYINFEDKYFDIGTKSYDELITIRNNLISERPEWMNSVLFINYENCTFNYHTEYIKLEKEWERYNESKTKGNSNCPFCRAH